MKLRFISVITKICLKGLLKSYSLPLFEWEQEKSGFFHNLLRLILVLLLACLLS